MQSNYYKSVDSQLEQCPYNRLHCFVSNYGTVVAPKSMLWPQACMLFPYQLWFNKSLQYAAATCRLKEY